MKKLSFFFLSSIILLSACHKVPPQIASEGQMRSTHAIRVERRLREADDQIRVIKGLAQVTLVDNESERLTDAALVVERPNRIRIDAFDTLADVWASAGTDGSRLWLWLPHKNKLYQGAITTRNLRKLAGFDWELSEITSILLGLVPEGRLAELEDIDHKSGHYEVVGKPLHVFVDPKKLYPIRVVRYKDKENVQYEASFSNWKVTNGIEFPTQVSVVFPESRSSLMVNYKEVEFNTQLESSFFKPQDDWLSKTVKMDK